MSSHRSQLDLQPTTLGSHVPTEQVKHQTLDDGKVEINSQERVERRLRLTKILEDGKGRVESFDGLMRSLGLWQKYRGGYKHSAINVFCNIARKALCTSNGSLKQTSYGGAHGPVEPFIPSNDKYVETRLVKFFIQMYEEMKEVADTFSVQAAGTHTTATPVEGPASSAATSTASTADTSNTGYNTRPRSAALHQRGNQDTTRDPSQRTDRFAPQNTAADAPAIPSPVNFPRPRHTFLDYQTHKVEGLKVKPDGAFVPLLFTSGGIHTFHCIFEAKVKLQNGLISDLVLGQIADYVQEVWEAQFTRTFVPVIYLSGGMAWLLIFAPSKWYQCEIGRICYTKENIMEDDAKKLSETLAKLWFILTRPDKDFGHFCPISGEQKAIKFTRRLNSNSDDSSDAPEPLENVLSDATFVDIEEEDSIEVRYPINSKVSVCGGRMSRIFRDNKYCCKDGQTRPAILKLSWTPVDRLPEGLIYEYLHESKDRELTDHIPKVYDSGIVSENVFDYRVEYIIMEDCGETVMENVLDQKKDGVSGRFVCEDLCNWLKRTTSILGYAYVHSVLHRDISTGNLIIGRKGLKIADWGLAKIKKEVLIKREDLAKKWLLTNSDDIAQNEEDHDKLTGTPLYTGIRISAQAKERGLIDDIESIWYAILHLWSLYKVGTEITSNIMAYIFRQSKSFAGLRAGCVSDSTVYMESFGADSMPKGELRDMLDDLYKVLFVDSNGPIGMKMAIDPGLCPRDHDSRSLGWLFGSDLSERLSRINLGDSSPSGANRRMRVVAGSQIQHGGFTQAEGNGSEWLHRPQQAISGLRPPPDSNPDPISQGLDSGSETTGPESSPLSSDVQGILSSSSSQSWQALQQHATSQPESDSQSDPIHLLQQQNVQLTARIQQLEQQNTQWKQFIKQHVRKRKSTGASDSSRKKTGNE